MENLTLGERTLYEFLKRDKATFNILREYGCKSMADIENLVKYHACNLTEIKGLGLKRLYLIIGCFKDAGYILEYDWIVYIYDNYNRTKNSHIVKNSIPDMYDNIEKDPSTINNYANIHLIQMGIDYNPAVIKYLNSNLINLDLCKYIQLNYPNYFMFVQSILVYHYKRLGVIVDKEDLSEINERVEEVKSWGKCIVRHFKGDLYYIEDIAIHTETGKEMVIYRAMYGECQLFARPLDMFAEKCTTDQVKNNGQKYRFELVNMPEGRYETFPTSSNYNKYESSDLDKYYNTSSKSK